MAKAQKQVKVSEAFLNNPILVQALGLTPVIIAATTLRAALWVAVFSAIHLIICEFLAAKWLKKLPDWLRIAIYCAIGLVMTIPTVLLMSRRSATELANFSLILPMMAFSALTAARCERYAISHTVGESMRDAASNALGYAAVVLPFSFIRELMGQGDIFGIQVSETLHVRAFWMPFGGFLLLGAMAAGLKMILRWLAQRGIAVGAEEAMELAPEDRLVRLEKMRRLREKEQPGPPAQEPQEEEQAADPFAMAPVKPIPVERVLLGDEEEAAEPLRPMSAEEKERLDRELEELLEDFQAGGEAK